jgi:AhpD family alkylhydroperoxidase
VVFDDLPLFEGVCELVAAGVIPGGTERNRESSLERVDMGEGVVGEAIDICCDPQTSGGLLIAVERDRAAGLLARLHGDGVGAAAIVGRVVGEGAGRVRIVTTGRRTVAAGGASESVAESAEGNGRVAGPVAEGEGRGAAGEPAAVRTERGANAVSMKSEDEEACCAGGDGAGAAAGPAAAGVAGIAEAFQAFSRAASAPGALDAATKQAISIALSVHAKCEPCVKAHIAKARKMGFTDEEIDEAAWLAIAFGGSPTMMFYRAVRGG